MASTGLELAERQLALAAADLLVGIEQHRRVERFLVAPVVVEHPLVGLGAGGDGIDPGAVEALLAELVAGGAEDLGLGLFGIARTGGAARLALAGAGPDSSSATASVVAIA